MKSEQGNFNVEIKKSTKNTIRFGYGNNIKPIVSALPPKVSLSSHQTALVFGRKFSFPSSNRFEGLHGAESVTQESYRNEPDPDERRF